ncbi:hypothetical protein INT45_009391 [Circinella minor]|uniref:RRM domain-containing protein n=1 Tax=Circinella minor TaxID=1195481 RepID=A0A8H7S708_9FUNG|nr:hypothetical protein INT45_009391 [Circinella minor]
MSEVENSGEQRYSIERTRSPRSRSRSRSPTRHSESRYRSRSRSREPSRNPDPEEQNPGDNLFITGLTTRTNSADLEELFNKYGKIQKAEVMYDPHTRESRGFGFIRMASSEDADRAITGINGTELDGRIVTVEKARRARPRTPTPGRYYGPPKRGGHAIRKQLCLLMVVLLCASVSRWRVCIDRFGSRSDYRYYDPRYEARPPRGHDPRYDRYYDRSYMDRYDPPRYDRGYERDRYDRGYDRAYDRPYDRGYDRYDRYDRRPPPPRYDPYPPRPRSPY